MSESERPPEELSFEQAREQLEGIVHRLEDGRTSLDDALGLWERGEQLYEICRAKLDGAEARVEELLRRAERTRRPPSADGEA